MHKDNIHHWTVKNTKTDFIRQETREMILQRFTDTVLCQLISLRYKQEFGSHLSKYVTSKSTNLLQKQTVF